MLKEPVFVDAIAKDKAGEEVKVRWWNIHRVRRVVRDSIVFAVSILCAIWWFKNTDWHHPVASMKELSNRFSHIVWSFVQIVWSAVAPLFSVIGSFLSEPSDWFLTAIFVAISVTLVALVIGFFWDLRWSLKSDRASHEYRSPY